MNYPVVPKFFETVKNIDKELESYEDWELQV